MKLLPAVLLLLSPLTNAATSQGPVVDLGYATYEGIRNASTGLSTFKGVRYAAPPTGQNRWRAPLPPAQNRTSSPQPAFVRSAQCPTSDRSPYQQDACPDLQSAATLPAQCANSTAFQQQIQGDEDCLFLDVYGPADAKDLPVFVWIHGGGYGMYDGTQNDQTNLINTNNNSFIGVTIRYRLGAFGFLSSDEVKENGVVNAGLLDQLFALQWVQDHIDKFGGDPTKVSIGGESAGGGSVMLLNMAYGGELGTKLWNNTIASSPYLPMQYDYSSYMPSQAYYAFAAKVGCFTGDPYGNSSQTVLDCLRGKDTLILQQASAITSASVRYGQWAFLPVTDGDLIRDLPSKQLKDRRVNGQRLLTTNNANEGVIFTPPNIGTEADFLDYIRMLFPRFNDTDVAELLQYYPSSNASTSASAPRFATNGLTPPTALNQSNFATGQQQRAEIVYAETTFICPSYWLADAFAPASHKYQYSVLPAQHGVENAFVFGPPPPTWSTEFNTAFKNVWGNFITRDDPRLDAQQAAAADAQSASIDSWPAWDPAAPRMLNLNETGGVATPVNATLYNLAADGPGTFNIPVTEFVDDAASPLMNDLAVVDAAAWEGGRLARCEFWRRVASRVPE